ncbi:hypothetical protein [Micromonospora sp. KC721]|uniref:hypothetical protein n=1 Tax=Micromonospora sp. KC721 TaxID=2530380 RepID=UPI0010481A6E|nr:hypothetical protein [Micromonospora sp. KC721]TDB80032.1 hypothetical protein E1182_10445 [Micromonospora sp. KC721]
MDLELTAPERALWTAFPRRGLVDLTDSEDRTVRAAVIRALLLGAAPAEPGQLAALALVGAEITGTLDLSYAEIPYPVRLSRCDLTDRFELVGARTREIDLAGSRLVGIWADRAVVEGNLRLSDVRCVDGVRLTAARIDGALVLDRAELVGAPALDARLLTVGHDIRGDALRCTGEVRLNHADIRGSVRLPGATLAEPDGRALAAVGLAAGGTLSCCDGFTADGRITIAFARVGRQVCFEHAHLRGALNCRQLQTDELVLATDGPVEGQLDLRHARLGVLRDDPETWPAAVRLNGLVYEAIDSPADVRRRLDWVGRDAGGYAPQAYEQLAATYRRRGEEDDARTVLLRGQRHRRAGQSRSLRLWGLVQDVTVGYGYRPTLAAFWLMALVAVGTAVFTAVPPTPLNPASPVRFRAPVYTIDLLLPLVDLRQESAFEPVGETVWVAYGLIACGLVLVTTIAAGTTRALRRT